MVHHLACTFAHFHLATEWISATNEALQVRSLPSLAKTSRLAAAMWSASSQTVFGLFKSEDAVRDVGYMQDDSQRLVL